MTTATNGEPVGIEAGKTYPLSEFKRIAGMGDFALRTARRNGLRIRYTGNRGFVSGQDFLAYLYAINADPSASEGGERCKESI